jgi:hypothetical protein
MTVFLAAQDKLEMHFNGPMRSGIVIDSQGLLNAGYHRFQKELAEKLRELYVGHWETPDFRGRKNNMSFDVDSFQGETIIPRFLISRIFEGEDLKNILNEFHLPHELMPPELVRDNPQSPQEAEKVQEYDPEFDTGTPIHEKRAGSRPEKRKATASFEIEKMDVVLYDYGYASCIVSGHVTAHKDLTIQEYRSAVEQISSALPDYTELFQSTIAKVAKVIPKQFVVMNFHDSDAKKEDEEETQWQHTTLRRHIGELFWVHRLFSVPCMSQVDFIRQKTEARALVYSSRTDVMDDVSLRPDMAVFPGHGNSCVVYTAGITPGWNIARLRATVRAKNVFYAALEDVDRDLFYLNNEIGQKGAAEDIGFLERYARYMSDCITRVNFLKSVYDDYDNQLDPQSIEIWNLLRKAWIMDDMFSAIDQKVAMLDKAHGRTVQRIAALQSKKLGALIVAFIGIALSALVLGVLGVFSRASVPDMSLWQVILLAFALGGATFVAVRFYRKK